MFISFLNIRVSYEKKENTLSHESATIMSSSKLKTSAWYLLTRTTYSGKFL